MVLGPKITFNLRNLDSGWGERKRKVEKKERREGGRRKVGRKERREGRREGSSKANGY
jgi:hypothetical protein